ncbi:MAG: DUF350 domain-containing protein [Bacteroidetes bacterium]|nr:MAG: DUF350 domain-containing protein [Bacteroidota bacterium]
MFIAFFHSFFIKKAVFIVTFPKKKLFLAKTNPCMNIELLILTTYQMALALSFGLLTVFITLKVVNNTVLKVNFFDLVRNGNIALAIFEGVLIFCVLFLVEISILPAVDALRTMAIAHQTFTFQMFLISFGYFLLFYAISLVFSYLLIISAFYVFISATAKLDEVQEIKNNNISAAILVGAVLLSVTLYMRPSLSNLVQSFVDYKSLEKPVVEETPQKEGAPQKAKPID